MTETVHATTPLWLQLADAAAKQKHAEEEEQTRIKLEEEKREEEEKLRDQSLILRQSLKQILGEPAANEIIADHSEMDTQFSHGNYTFGYARVQEIRVGKTEKQTLYGFSLTRLQTPDLRPTTPYHSATSIKNSLHRDWISTAAELGQAVEAIEAKCQEVAQAYQEDQQKRAERARRDAEDRERRAAEEAERRAEEEAQQKADEEARATRALELQTQAQAAPTLPAPEENAPEPLDEQSENQLAFLEGLCTAIRERQVLTGEGAYLWAVTAYVLSQTGKYDYNDY